MIYMKKISVFFLVIFFSFFNVHADDDKNFKIWKQNFKIKARQKLVFKPSDSIKTSLN